MEFIQELSPNVLWYLIGVVLLGLLVFSWSNIKLRSAQKQSTDKLKSKRIKEVTGSIAPRGKYTSTKVLALEALESRFKNFRTAAYTVIGFFFFFLLCIPFLTGLSGTYLSVFIGIITVIAGMAAKPFIENLIAGLVISFSNPMRAGDTVTVDSHYGTIERISALYTVVKIWNWKRYMIPNYIFLQKEFINHTKSDTFEKAEVEFFVAPESDIAVVEKIALEAMSGSEYLTSQNTEPPNFWVMNTGEHSVRCWVAGWVKSPSDAWSIRSETRKKLMTAFQEQGIKTHSYELISKQ